jgi:hypothetical protein
LTARRVAMRANSMGPPRSAALVISGAAVLCPGGYRDSRALGPQAALGLIKPHAVRPDVRPCKATARHWRLPPDSAHAKTEFNGTGGLLTYIGLVPGRFLIS